MKRFRITRKTISDEQGDHANWPEVSTAGWSESDISRFNRLRAALEAYLNGERIADIETWHNASSSVLVDCLNRCLAAADDGRIQGWRGLIKHLRIKDYERVASDITWTGKAGLSGCFTKLLLNYPAIAEGLVDFILKSPKKRDRIIESGTAFQGIFQKFLDLCIEAGRLPGQYPLNTESRGSASVRRFAHQVRKARFETGAKLLGGDVGASRTAPGTGMVSLLTADKPYDMFQLDEHKMDFIGVVLMQTPKGPQLIPISRLILILVVEVKVQCVVGYHMAIRGEASAEEMVLTMANVVGQWRPRQLVIDYVKYMPGAGLPSGVIPELEGACAAEMQVDNSMAHWSRAFVDRIRQRTGMSINWGPVGHWVRRQVVERVFGILEKRGFQRLISTTGSHPRDVRKSDPVGAAIRHEIELEEILDLIDVVIANFNAKGTSALGGRSPLDVLRHYVTMNAFGFLPRRLPALPSHVPDMTTLVVKVTIHGSQGVHAIRQYVEKFYARYTSPMLASSASLIGHEVTLHINTQDPRTAKAFFKDGGSLGMLTAMGTWGVKPHTLEMRKEIGRLIHQGKLHVLTGEDEITAFNRHLFEKGQKKRDQNKGRPTISKEATKAAHYASATGEPPKAGVPMAMPPRRPVPPPPAPAMKPSGKVVGPPAKPPRVAELPTAPQLSRKTAMSSTNGLAPTFATVPVQGSLFAEFDPLDAQMRQIYIADHPLMLATGGYALPTPPIVAVLTQIISSIMAGTPGIAWVAVPRFGKTTAIRLIKEKIGETLNGTPVVVHVARRHAKADEGRFYRELLEASDIAVPPGRDAGERFNRLWKGWWSWVLTRRSKRIALIIDEAQKLSEAEYSWLIDVANILAEKRISLCVVLFGQPELLSLRQTFFQVGRMDILGRFMVQVHTFEGIKNAEQLAEVMQALDDEALSEYPLGSHCACTQFFAPRAFAAGWRLHDHAIPLWGEFERCAVDMGQDFAANPMQVAMAWVRIALVHALQQIMVVDHEKLILPENVWRNAAECSGYQQSLGVLDKPVDLDDSDA